MEEKVLLAEITADVVSAYVTNNKLPADELPDLIKTVHHTFANLDEDAPGQTQTNQPPAIAIEDSITEKHLICLEDGMQFRSLKRHLRAHHDMSPQQYREKWSLPTDYPMVAPSYSLKRSELARQSGLGRGRKKS